MDTPRKIFAAIKIQKIIRGALQRMQHSQRMNDLRSQAKMKKVTEDKIEAALVIQSHVRGMIHRRKQREEKEKRRQHTLQNSKQPGIRSGVHQFALHDDELREEFRKYDVDGNGFITKDEFRNLYKGMDTLGVPESPKEIEKLLKRYNLLGDDKLSYEEFAILMLKIAKR
eukprot:PhF_6_TR36075/c0_g1_i1/m.52407